MAGAFDKETVLVQDLTYKCNLLDNTFFKVYMTKIKNIPLMRYFCFFFIVFVVIPSFDYKDRGQFES